MAMLNFLNRWTGGLNHCGTVPLSTPRLILRRFSLDDTRPMFENWACDPDVTQYLTWRAHMTSRETRDVLEYWESQYRRADFYEWAIVPKDYGRPIGSIGMSRLSHSKTSMELGYCIGKAWWGQGICAEAAGAVLRLMFEEVGCLSVIAMHALPNTSSGRVMEKCGMHPKNCPPEPVKTENGLFYCRVYELDRTEYEQWLACRGRVGVPAGGWQTGG